MKRQLDLTHRQARRAARIVQNLLEFSRPASPQKKGIDLSTIIERTCSCTSIRCARKSGVKWIHTTH